MKDTTTYWKGIGQDTGHWYKVITDRHLVHVNTKSPGGGVINKLNWPAYIKYETEQTTQEEFDKVLNETLNNILK